jgi:hypothetical protein
MAEQDAQSSVRGPGSVGMSEGAPNAPADEEDAMLADSGMGGQYEPLLEDEPAGSGDTDVAALPPGEPIKIAEVHFNSGSATLTPGGARRTREAVGRIRSMEPYHEDPGTAVERLGDGESARGRLRRQGWRRRPQPDALAGARAFHRSGARERRPAAGHGRGRRQRGRGHPGADRGQRPGPCGVRPLGRATGPAPCVAP